MDELEFNAIGKALTSALAEAKKATEKMGPRYLFFAVVNEQGICVDVQGVTKDGTWAWHEAAAAMFSAQYAALEKLVAAAKSADTN